MVATTACTTLVTAMFGSQISILISIIVSSVGSKEIVEIGDHSKYEATWESLDARPIPAWYDEAKVGVKVSWGVSSVPGFRNEWFWHSWEGDDPDPKSIEFMRNNYPPRFTYQVYLLTYLYTHSSRKLIKKCFFFLLQDFARDFTAEFFDPYKLADILQSSGAKYVVFTSKHHDGYALYPSAYSFGWNSMDTGPRRDLIGEFSKAIRNRTSIKFGLYHSLYEWFHPLYLKDKERNFQTREFLTHKIFPEFVELVRTLTIHIFVCVDQR